MNAKNARGFSLLEVLVVASILALLAAMAIANYFNGLEKAKQKRTMNDIRTIANAWESRATEMRGYSAAGASALTFPPVPVPEAAMETLLTPTYSRTFPRSDGWNRPFLFAMDQPAGSSNPATTYGIRSAGRDAVFESTYTPGPTDDFDCDIVFVGGSFVVYPVVK